MSPTASVSGSFLICACMYPGQPPYWRCISCINLIWLELFLGVRLSWPSAADVLFCQAYLLWLVKPISLSLYQPLQCSAGIYASEELDSEEIMLQILPDCLSLFKALAGTRHCERLTYKQTLQQLNWTNINKVLKTLPFRLVFAACIYSITAVINHQPAWTTWAAIHRDLQALNNM